MGKQKTETTSSSNQSGSFSNQNQMGFSDPYESADIDAFRAFRPQSDPTIPFRFANARQQIQSTYANPTGAYATPELQAQRQMSALGDLRQEEGQASRVANFDVNQQRGNQLGQIAGMTRPEFYQMGSSGTSSGMSAGKGVQIAPSNLLGNFLGGVGAGLTSFI